MLRPLWITLKITDTKTGKLLRSRHWRSRSYLLAMTDLLYAQMSQLNLAGVIDTSGVSRAASAHQYSFSLLAAAGDATLGTVVGTGVNAVAIADYQLQTKIAHGVGATQLQYGLQTIQTPITSGSTRLFSMTRTFINGSGASITVQEAGLYGLSAGTPYIFCFVRDRIAGGQVVAAGETLTVQYDIGVTV